MAWIITCVLPYRNYSLNQSKNLQVPEPIIETLACLVPYKEKKHKWPLSLAILQ